MQNRDFIETPTLFKLEQWGIFARDGTVSRLLMRTRPDLKTNIEITDEQGMYVDRGACALKRRDPQLAEILIGYYVKGHRIIELEERLGMSARRVSGLLKAAEAWMDSYFFMHELGGVMVDLEV